MVATYTIINRQYLTHANTKTSKRLYMKISEAKKQPSTSCYRCIISWRANKITVLLKCICLKNYSGGQSLCRRPCNNSNIRQISPIST